MDRDFFDGLRELTPLLVFFAVFYGSLLLAGLASYLLRAIGLYKVCKHIYREPAGLAFVPIANQYIHGAAAGPIKLGKRTIKDAGVVMLVAPFVVGLVFVIMYIPLIIIMIVCFAGVELGNPAAGLVTLMVAWVVFVVVIIAAQAFLTVLRALVNNNIFLNYVEPNVALVHTILSSLIPLYEAIYFFTLRNKVPLWAVSVTAPAAAQEITETPVDKK